QFPFQAGGVQSGLFQAAQVQFVHKGKLPFFSMAIPQQIGIVAPVQVQDPTAVFISLGHEVPRIAVHVLITAVRNDLGFLFGVGGIEEVGLGVAVVPPTVVCNGDMVIAPLDSPIAVYG